LTSKGVKDKQIPWIDLTTTAGSLIKDTTASHLETNMPLQMPKVDSTKKKTSKNSKQE
jgi:hypothetical protein